MFSRRAGFTGVFPRLFHLQVQRERHFERAAARKEVPGGGGLAGILTIILALPASLPYLSFNSLPGFHALVPVLLAKEITRRNWWTALISPIMPSIGGFPNERGCLNVKLLLGALIISLRRKRRLLAGHRRFGEEPPSRTVQAHDYFKRRRFSESKCLLSVSVALDLVVI